MAGDGNFAGRTIGHVYPQFIPQFLITLRPVFQSQDAKHLGTQTASVAQDRAYRRQNKSLFGNSANHVYLLLQ